MKNVLIIYYSQSEQLKDINLAKPLLKSNEVFVLFHETKVTKAISMD